MSDTAVGALIGGGFALAGVVIGWLLNRLTDNRAFRRNRKAEAYTSFIAAFGLHLWDRTYENYGALNTELAKLQVFGSPAVYDLADSLSRMCRPDKEMDTETIGTLVADLNKQCRNELGMGEYRNT